MKIKSLKARNIKGQSFELNLEPINVITSKNNFSGKTAILDALFLALTGAHPKLPKTGPGIFQLASASKMEVEITTDADKTFERAWEKKGKGVTFSGTPDPVCDLYTIDPALFLAKSGPERTKFIFSRAKIEGIDPEAILKKILAIKGSDVSADALVAQAAIEKARDTVKKEFDATDEIQIGIASAIKESKDSISVAKAEVARMEKTVQGLVQIRDEDANAVAGITEEDIVKDEKEIAAELQVINHRLGELQSEAKTAKDNASLAKELREEIEEIEGNLPDEATAASATPEALATLKKNRDDLSSDLSKLRTSLGSTNAEIVRLTAEADKLSKELAAIDHLDSCPTCGNNYSKEFKEHARKNVADRINANNEAFKIASKEKGEYTRDGQAKREQHDNLVKRVESMGSLLAKVTEGNRLPILRERLVKLGSPVEIDNKEAEDAERAKLVPINERASSLKKKRQILANTLAYAKSVAEAEEKTKAGNAEMTAYKLTVKLLEGEQEEVMDASFKPILSIAENFSRGIFKTPLEYNEGELGRYEKGIWVSIDLFSGAEQVVAYAALSCALAITGGVRIAVVDEMDVINEENRDALFINVGRMINDGALDHFFGTTKSVKWAKTACKNKGCKLIEV